MSAFTSFSRDKMKFYKPFYSAIPIKAAPQLLNMTLYGIVNNHKSKYEKYLVLSSFDHAIN